MASRQTETGAPNGSGSSSGGQRQPGDVTEGDHSLPDLCACCGSGDGLPAALKVLRRSRDYIVMMSSLNSGPSLPGLRLAEVWHGR
jgi:hypothetical protein